MSRDSGWQESAWISMVVVSWGIFVLRLLTHITFAFKDISKIVPNSAILIPHSTCTHTQPEVGYDMVWYSMV